MRRSTDNPWLKRFAVFTAVATLCLIGIGGIVTSKGVGMSVPDWPTTYGYNMFLFPISKWVGGIREEHSHRLFASWVGLLTTILAVWLWIKEDRRWLRWLGVIAFFAVVLQGVLGGLRVVLIKDEIGIFHAGLAQAFFCLTVAIAIFLSRWWQQLRSPSPAFSLAASQVKPLVLFTTGLIFLQLMLGATMRHQHAGLAVPDFPLAYGKVWPDTDPVSIDRYNRERTDVRDFNAITPAQIYLHMAHRLTAFLILGLVVACWARAKVISPRPEARNPVRRLTGAWVSIITLQAVLGVVTVLKNKPADIATAHVVVGAASLALGMAISLMLSRLAQERALENNPRLQAAMAESRG